MSYSLVYGPKLKQRGTGGYPTDSSVSSFIKYEVTNVVRRKKPEGINLLLSLTPYYHQSFYVRNGLQRSGDSFSPTGYQADPALGPYSGVPDLFGRIAWTDLYKSLQNNKFDAATFLGELPETVRWLADVGKEMMDAYLAIKKGRWTRYLPRREVVSGKRRKYIRQRGPRYRIITLTRRDGSQYNARLSLDGSLSKRYLEWRFAVQPVIQEIGNFMDAFAEQCANPMISHVTGNFNCNEPIVGYFQKGSRRVRVRANAYYKITSGAKWLQKWGGINLVATLWNLAPLSFMVDRFFPVGQLLSNFDAEMGVEWMSYSTSITYDFEIVTTPPTGGVWNHEVCSATGKGNIRELKKFTDLTLPKPTLDRADFQTALDLLALTRTIGESLLKR